MPDARGLTYQISGNQSVVLFFLDGRSIPWVNVPHFAPALREKLVRACQLFWPAAAESEIRTALAVAHDELLDLGLIAE